MGHALEGLQASRQHIQRLHDREEARERNEPGARQGVGPSPRAQTACPCPRTSTAGPRPTCARPAGSRRPTTCGRRPCIRGGAARRAWLPRCSVSHHTRISQPIKPALTGRFRAARRRDGAEGSLHWVPVRDHPRTKTSMGTVRLRSRGSCSVRSSFSMRRSSSTTPSPIGGGESFAVERSFFKGGGRGFSMIITYSQSLQIGEKNRVAFK